MHRTYLVDSTASRTKDGRYWRILAIDVVVAFFGMPNRAWSKCEGNTAFVENGQHSARSSLPNIPGSPDLREHGTHTIGLGEKRHVVGKITSRNLEVAGRDDNRNIRVTGANVDS